MLFTFLGMPISTTYSIVGAISGAGLVKGAGTVNVSFIRKVFLNWILAPLLSFGICDD